MGSYSTNFGIQIPQLAAAGAGAAAGVGGALAATNTLGAVSAWTEVGAVIAKIASIIAHVMGGCGGACIEASEIEQVFEAAADNLAAVGKAGMITRTQAVQGMNALIQAGGQMYGQYPQLAQHAKDGLANMTRVIQDEIQWAQNNLADSASVALSVQAARQYYIPANKPGWYPKALGYATQITDQLLSHMTSAFSVSSVTNDASALASNPVAAISQIASNPKGHLATLAIAGLLAWKFL